MIEIWKEVVGFEGIEVSNFGQIRSWRKSGVRPAGALLFRKEPKLRIATVNKHKGGYLEIRLTQGSSAKKIHTLVLEAFVGPRPPGYQCRHLDGNPKNNRLDNLQWGTPIQNNADKLIHGTLNTGIRNGNAKFAESDILYIRNSTESYKELAEKFSTTRKYISQIRCRGVWTWL